MDNAASGELPLHQDPSPSPTNISFTYADYWRSLNSSPPGAHATGTAPMHTTSYAKRPAHDHDEKGEDEENKMSPLTVKPHRIVHAATDAYRLRLSLSPSPTKASKPTPLSLRSPNVTPQTFNKKSALTTPLPRRATTTASPVVADAEMDEYVVDTHVLLAVRCYEEWRRCLCAEDSAAAVVVVADDVNTLQREARVMSDGVAASSGLRPADTVRWVSDDAHKKPVSAFLLSPPSPPVHMAEVVAVHDQSSSSSATPETAGFATKTLFTASPSSPANPASGAVDRTSTSSNGHSSGATHGLTSGRVIRERSGSRGASASWRVVSPAASASPWTRKEGPPTVRPARAQEAPSPPGPVHRRLFADDKDDVDDLPTAAAASASGAVHAVIGARGNVSYAAGQRLRTQGILGTSLPPTAVAAATAAVVPVYPTAHTPLETVIELSCSSSERDTSDDECNFFAEADEAQKETRFESSLRGTAAVDGDDVGQENNLQATSASSHSAPPSPPGSALFIIDATATGKPMSMTDADALSNSDGRHDDQEAKQSACKEMESSVSATSAAVQHHPLYMKHHAAVSQLYASRLLECERGNDELQLFLCWAQERAERREERQSQKPERLNDVSPCSSFVGDGVDDSAASVQRGTAAAVQEVFRSAYTHQRGPQLRHALSPSISGAPTRESKKMAVYVAPPLADAAAAIQNIASPCKTTETAFCDDGATWLTPSSPNSRFIAWVADEVDVYEALTL